MNAARVPGPCELAYLNGQALPVSEEETVELLNRSSASQPYIASFGPRGVALRPHERAKWAYIVVDELRAKATGAAS